MSGHIVECTLASKRPRAETNTTPAPAQCPPVTAGRVPRIARLMALALRFEQLLRSGAVRDYAGLARLGRVSRARITQVMNLLHLAPDLQEEILFLAPVLKPSVKPTSNSSPARRRWTCSVLSISTSNSIPG